VDQPETPQGSVDHVPVGPVPWTDSPIIDSLASSIMKCHMTTVSTALGVVILNIAFAAVIWRVKQKELNKDGLQRTKVAFLG